MLNPDDVERGQREKEDRGDNTASDVVPTVVGVEPERIYIPTSCIVHLETSPLGALLPMKPNIWDSILKAASLRRSKKRFESSKYFGAITSLPDVPKPHQGYHVYCYKNFTAVPITDSPLSTNSSDKNVKVLRSSCSVHVGESTSQNTSGVFPEDCLFCNKKRLSKGKFRVEMLGSCETLEAGESIRRAAEILHDDKMLTKIAGVDFVAKEVKYHHSCKSKYLKSAERAKMAPREVNLEKTCVDEICSYVESSVINDSRSELLASIFDRYVDMCGDADEIPVATNQSLSRILLRRFDGRLKLQSPKGKKLGVVVYNAQLADEAVRVAFNYRSSAEGSITQAALLLRTKIKAVTKKEFSDPLTCKSLKEGEASPPDLVRTFFRILYGGPNKDKHSSSVQRRAESASQDALFIVRNGSIRPQKHVVLGMSVKSMTGSRKLVTILNRFGHCINYSCVEELETEIAHSQQDTHVACPDGTQPNLPIGLAFDNYDELSYTLSGADTLHDTMGILYQIEGPPQPDVPASSTGSKEPKRKKRKLDIPDLTIPPYNRKPKMTSFTYKKTDVFLRPEYIDKARSKDLIWMMCQALELENIPMWAGFNARYYTDHLPKQVVYYMPNLKQPPTCLDVVVETLRITKRCASECQQKYGIVSYDLNIAKPAMQIQATEAPLYDDVFIMFGAFHIQMCFFKAIGKVVAESGGPKMLTECDVLAPGSLRGFISGTHFNRCKRIHPILALALRVLHFREFLSAYGHNEELRDVLQLFSNQSKWEEVETQLVQDVLTKYEEYTEDTRSGIHGKTAQFWVMYLDYIQHYQLLDRAIRTSDVELFIYALTPMIGLFFVTSHVNYSRWMTKYQLNLLNVDETHPGLRPVLENGAFSVRRSDNDFSRCPVDLVLEQTVNADAASRLTGLSAATNNYNARLRWMMTKSTRASMISTLQATVGLVGPDSVIADARPCRIKRDTSDLRKVIHQINQSCNPFHDQASDGLFNIHTGKAASKEVEKSLLSVPQVGKIRHKDFIDACIADPSKFEQPIKKGKLKNFESECAVSRRSSDRKVAELRCTRDLMGRLLILANKQMLDLPHVLAYPLTPVPLALCHTDGTMCKTNKNKLMHILESKVEDGMVLSTVDACVIDGNFILHAMPPNLPGTYGGLARMLLIQITSLCRRRIDIVFDTYKTPSIKDLERGTRGAQDTVYNITGPDQARPKKLSDALKSASFKHQLPSFLVTEWEKPEYSSIIGERDVFVGHDSTCHRFHVQGGMVIKDTIDALTTNHQEGDTRVCLHVKAISDSGVSANTVVRASDTDIAVILLHHCHKYATTVWMDVGTGKSRRCINITSIANKIGREMCAALPGLHSFTGCDYTSSFVKAGKGRPFTLVEKSQVYKKAFAGLAEPEVTDEVESSLEQFTCTLYRFPSESSINSARWKSFEKAFGPSATSKNPLQKLRGIDASSLPPCKAELVNHLKRSAFVTRMWAAADQPFIEQEPLEGWEVVDGRYEIVWFSSPQLPADLFPEDATDDDDNEELVLSSDDEVSDLE